MKGNKKLIIPFILFHLIICCAYSAFANNHIWTECSKRDPLATINQISMTGCDLESNSKSCSFPKGKKVAISVDFTPSEYHCIAQMYEGPSHLELRN